MCLAIPAEIIHCLSLERAIVNLGGIKKEISIELVDDVMIGDFVVVHVGYALSKLNKVEAKKTLQLLEKIFEEYQEDVAS